MVSQIPDTREPATSGPTFDVVDQRLVRIDVDGFVWIKRGSVVAYQGDLRFHRESVIQPEGIHLRAGPVRSSLDREEVPLAKAEGRGCLYISNDSQYSRVIRLDGETLYVSAFSFLACEPTVEHAIVTLGAVGVLGGELFAVRLSGHGFVAFSVNGPPLALPVTPANPVSTNPTATVAWTAGLWPELKTDLEIGSLVAHGGGEPIQMCFRGRGQVFVTARSRTETMRSNVLKSLTSKIAKLFA